MCGSIMSKKRCRACMFYAPSIDYRDSDYCRAKLCDKARVNKIIITGECRNNAKKNR